MTYEEAENTFKAIGATDQQCKALVKCAIDMNNFTGISFFNAVCSIRDVLNAYGVKKPCK